MRSTFWLGLLIGLSLCGWVIFQGMGLRLPPADLRFGNQSEPQTLDPAKMTGVPEGRIARALFEGLTIPNLSDLSHPKPGAAMRWSRSKDGRTYTFFLRENARWSNGKPVTANHFLFAWRRLLAPTTGSNYAELLWSVKNAREYNQGLFYVTSKTLQLRPRPVDSDPVSMTLPKHTVVVQRDVGMREVAAKKITLWRGPASQKRTHSQVRRGQLVHILDRRKAEGQIWYRVTIVTQGPWGGIGWLPEEHLARRSKRLQTNSIEWFLLQKKDDPSVMGWARRFELKKPDYSFPTPTKTKGTARSKFPVLKQFQAWKWLGLRVKNVPNPPPRAIPPKP